MGVMMQGFYWDCHKEENHIEKWWIHLKEKVQILKNAGFTGLWLPPAHKGDQRHGMGYDPFDFFDLGEFDQRGGIPTGFGTRQQLADLIQKCHDNGIEVYADVVYNHCSGGEQELNPDTHTRYFTKFSPASEKFPRDYSCFNPSGIDALITAHEGYAGGDATTRFVSDDLYIMERLGWGDKPGLICVFNNRSDTWQGRWVQTNRSNIRYEPIAWRGHANMATPLISYSAGDGRAQFWAPPRGYTVYVPK